MTEPRPYTSVVIPAHNEEASLPLVLQAIPGDWVDEVIVCDNGSTDETAAVACAGGARVVYEPRMGYGRACLAALAELSEASEIVVFLDADFSDHPEELPRLVNPILEGKAELVIGSRTRGCREPGALLPQARFGNALACGLLRWLFGARFTDLGPFRAIGRSALDRIDMRDPTFGWTVEMQAKATALGIPCAEEPVSYRRRVGVSKITGTVKGTILAGTKILSTIALIWWRQNRLCASDVGAAGSGRAENPSASESKIDA